MSEEKMDPRLVEARIAEAEANAQLAQATKKIQEATYEWTVRRQREELAGSDNHGLFEFWGSVNDLSVANLVRALGQFSRTQPFADISIVFNSPGGGVWPGLALYDYIQALKEQGHKITTSTVGMAASMGGILLQAGSERVAGANSYMLIHEISSGAIGKVSEMEDEMKLAKRLQDRLVGILAERSTLTPAQVRHRWKRVDWWLDSKEMLEFGFVDRIQ